MRNFAVVNGRFSRMSGVISLPTKPSAATTGCRSPTGTLTAVTNTYVQSQITSGVRGFSNLMITGAVTVRAAGVSFIDCVFEPATPGTRSDYWMFDSEGYDSVSVTYCTFNGRGDVTGGAIDTAVITGPNGTVSYCNINGCQDGIHPGVSGTISHNYIHGNVAPAGAHSDGIQIFSTVSGLTLNGNTVDVSDGSGPMNAAIQFGHFNTGSTVDSLVITNNWFNGGGYTLSGDFTDQTNAPFTPTNTYASGNKFGLSFVYNTPVGLPGMLFTSDPTNVWETTGSSSGTGRAVVGGQPVS